MSDPTGDEVKASRVSERRAVQTEFRLGDESGHGEIVLDTHDLSSGGAFLTADLLFEPEEVLQLEFDLPGVEGPIRTRGRVAWVSRGADGHPPGMGIEFLDLDPGTRTLLASLLGTA